MKKLLVVFVLIGGMLSTSTAEPVGHFHRSPSHHGHPHHHHTRLNTPEQQKPVH